jgi:hypothetical protein
LAVLIEEVIVLVVLELVKLVEVSVAEAVLLGSFLSVDQCFLDEWFGVGRLLGDDLVFPENVIP